MRNNLTSMVTHYFNTMKLLTLTLLILAFISGYSQKRNLPIDSISHIQIDSIVFYDDPYVISNTVHENNGFKPVWQLAYDATANPLSFGKDAKKAMLYLHESLGIEESGLQNFYNNWIPKPDPNIDLTWYALGDIYFTDKNSQIHYIYSPAWGARYNLPVRLSELDTAKLGVLDRDELDSSDMYYPFYRDDHGTYSLYVYEDNIYKDYKALELYDILKWNHKSSGGTFSSAKGFIKLVDRQETYIRSRLINGNRIFETVKNTPNGPVVVGEKDDEKDKAGEQSYWWMIVIGLVAVALLGYVVFKRRKKEK